MNKLLQDIEGKKEKIKSKKKKEQLKIMLDACKLMSSLCDNSDEENDEIQDNLRNSLDPNINIEITKQQKGIPILPSNISDTSELDTEISDIHRQMSGIKGILKTD